MAYISNLLPHCTLNQLKQIHALIITTSLCQNFHIFSTFLRRSTEFGSMVYSDLIFSKMGTPFYSQIMPWNIMVRGYAFNGPLEDCLSVFDELPHRGLKPDNYTYPYVLNSCAQLGLCRKSQNVHCQILKSGFESSFEVSNSLFNMYLKMQASLKVNKGERSGARKVFDDMPVKPVEVWNQMIYQCVCNGNVSSAIDLFVSMPVKDVISWNTMILGYSRVGELSKARDLFERIPEKNVVSWTSMIGAYADARDLDTARKIFEKMPCRNVVSWNSMISSYTKHERFQEALDLFEQMQLEGVVSDEYTFVSVLSACSHLGALEIGKRIHFLIQDWPRLGVIVRTALVDMYAKCGDISRAFTLFIKIKKNDVFCWNVMIKSLAIHGRTEDAIRIFFLMQKDGLKPNDFTFTSVLFACSHGGLVEEGRKIFYSMERDFGVSPKLEHFGCFVDLLSRNGQLEEAQLLVKDMPYKPDIAIWGALLGGCRVRSDLKLAEKVIERATKLDSKESGVHVLSSNIHASVGQWPQALNARLKMEERKVLKKVGSSTIV
ncbi:pentatricopeptide repeat-containing protein At3g29230-like [Herrania umbratica]|uniref:Pentatricopeptide repeat-containing protein At3g29230-like n=1 Tax=Herrania umbratica TaxID=108875 RepID=A0A6J1B1W5_9ROSI|nr:pentatricopeptide repeat-containing protein At3g29230-like [Herrania umbratica]